MLKKGILAVSVFLAVSAAGAEVKSPDVNGIWTDVAGPNFANTYLVLAQDGNEVHMAHYLEFKGMPMVEYGQGSFDKGKIVLHVKVSKPIPGWATAGTHTLQLSEDGDSLKGEYADSLGNKGPLEFKRLRPVR
jgi:hypothetical protein